MFVGESSCGDWEGYLYQRDREEGGGGGASEGGKERVGCTLNNRIIWWRLEEQYRWHAAGFRVWG